MLRTISLHISGLGIVLYSPWATAHIEPNADFLAVGYSSENDVTALVNVGAIVGVCTGSPGTYFITLYSGERDEAAVVAAAFRVRLCVEIRDKMLCIRDLYDLISWSHECQTNQTVFLENGFYRLTAYTSLPPSGIHGDDQAIFIHFESMSGPFTVAHSGVPQLC